MTTTSTLSSIDGGLAALEFARGATLKLAADIPEDKMTHRPQPGANHAAWLLGHLAYADDGFHAKLSGNPSQLSENHAALFGMGSEPTDDADAYPSKAELIATLEKTHATLVEWFQSLDEEKLASPLPEDWAMFGPNHAAVASTLAWHEGMHAGQLVEVRRSLDLPRAFG